MIYFNTKKYGFVYNHLTQQVEAFNNNLEFLGPMYQGKLDPIQGKLLRKDAFESCLFLRSSEKEISVFFDLGKFPLQSNIHRFRGVPGGSIVDFYPFDLKKLMVVTQDGFISIFQDVSKAKPPGSYLFQINMLEGESVTAAAICSRDTFLTVSTRIGSKACRLLVFNFTPEFKLKKRAEQVLDQTEWFAADGSFFSDLNMDFYIDDYPMVLGFQRFGSNLMIPYILNYEKLGIFRQPISYHNDNFGKCVYLSRSGGESGEIDRGEVWSTDSSGLVKRLKLVQ